MKPAQKAALTRAINRFERAVDDKAFEGSIPWDCDEAIERHEEIDREYAASRTALIAFVERLAK
jgi:hypothetical protein